ncbi:peptide chain release factor N(5)-glutamine methyltransferase [Buchnera aphidicola (Mindarus keteleerifoliae)]|uniref:peptide chain release factor N(5)-glutamine methyltransferase n=1 Tax=Buchnera aphidicola TaxID=9 RepID=UPI0031B71A73
MLKRRTLHEPVAYLIKKKEFWSLSLLVSPFTFIPRPETEIIIEIIQNMFDKQSQLHILDLGTGSGAIALSLADIFPNSYVIGIDQIYNAVKIAKKNARKLSINNVFFMYSDWFSSLERKNFHIIVSNPPYVSAEDYQSLKSEIFFEPYSALVSPEKGYFDLKKIIRYSQNYLYHKGWLLIEHGSNQKKFINKFMKFSNFKNVNSYRDHQGFYRVTIGQKN